MKQLYKLDSTNKTRYLKIYTKGPVLIQESGVLGTDSPVVHEKVCKGKNIGRSNETSPEEQAVLEMNSKVAEKLTKGYFESQDELEEAEVVLPMLALSYEDEQHKINWDEPVYVQPKLDGQRCLAEVKGGSVRLISRQGKIISTLEHLNKALSKFPDGVYDGEAYSLELGPFQAQMRAIKKYRPGVTEKIAFNMYDIINDQPFKDRNKIISKLKVKDPIRLLETYLIKNEDELIKYYGRFIQEGYEGAIVRHGNGAYKINGRSANLLKYKKFKDLACKVVDVTPADSRPSWGILVCKMDNGNTFKASLKMSHEEKEEILTNKKSYIGQTAEVRFFEYSEDGIPRFPICVGFREDK